ncbi:ABC transporter permease [Halalkalirubrum salinum]|uniref:ABC transporter permease n=1 Tax=Halalkalirubrum salinum TaxID=2563889 RepID=UPI0010FB4B66|nr:ABC transporter permease [Halalkalirubrum salinum]
MSTSQSPIDAKADEIDDVEEHLTLRKRLWGTLKRDKKSMLGAIVILSFLLVAIFAPYVAPVDPEQEYGIMEPPNTHSETADGEAYHLLGTDSYGYDIFSRIIFGARISLLVALVTVLFAFTTGTAIGLAAGYYGGWIDSLLMRYVDFQWAFPTLILAAGIIAVSGSLGVINVIIAVGVAFIDDFARLVRSEVLSLREKEYVVAARAIGMSDRRIMIKEILPNAVASLIVQVTLMIPIAILAEASLSFLGLGVRPTTPTWGLMLNEGRQFITQAWWLSIFPGFAIMIVVLAFNAFGDGLRDAFDVKEGEVLDR